MDSQYNYETITAMLIKKQLYKYFWTNLFYLKLLKALYIILKKQKKKKSIQINLIFDYIESFSKTYHNTQNFK